MRQHYVAIELSGEVQVVRCKSRGQQQRVLEEGAPGAPPYLNCGIRLATRQERALVQDLEHTPYLEDLAYG